MFRNALVTVSIFAAALSLSTSAEALRGSITAAGKSRACEYVKVSRSECNVKWIFSSKKLSRVVGQESYIVKVFSKPDYGYVVVSRPSGCSMVGCVRVVEMWWDR